MSEDMVADLRRQVEIKDREIGTLRSLLDKCEHNGFEIKRKEIAKSNSRIEEIQQKAKVWKRRWEENNVILWLVGGFAVVALGGILALLFWHFRDDSPEKSCSFADCQKPQIGEGYCKEHHGMLEGAATTESIATRQLMTKNLH